MFVGQFADDEFHFTSLLNYQKHQENAPTQFDIKHYTELEDDKGKYGSSTIFRFLADLTLQFCYC